MVSSGHDAPIAVEACACIRALVDAAAGNRDAEEPLRRALGTEEVREQLAALPAGESADAAGLIARLGRPG
jgi:hypothetical protein